jgi:hypothetical protein
MKPFLASLTISLVEDQLKDGPPFRKRQVIDARAQCAEGLGINTPDQCPVRKVLFSHSWTLNSGTNSVSLTVLWCYQLRARLRAVSAIDLVDPAVTTVIFKHLKRF